MTTKISIARRVLTEIQQVSEEPSGIFLPDVVGQVPVALEEMCRAISISSDAGHKRQIERSFTGTIVSDTPYNYVELNNSSFMSATEPLIIEPPFRTVEHADEPEEFLYCPDDHGLRTKDTDEGFAWYSIQGTGSSSVKLYIKSNADLTGTLTVTGCAVISVTYLSKELEQMLIDLIKARIGEVVANKGRKR